MSEPNATALISSARLCVFPFRQLPNCIRAQKWLDGAKTARARLEEWLQAFVILPYDNETARAWARIRAERKHTPIAPQDAWVAACAIRHKCPLITHNASDYADINGLVILTEREA